MARVTFRAGESQLNRFWIRGGADAELKFRALCAAALFSVWIALDADHQRREQADH
jgi:hypothetical protein